MLPQAPSGFSNYKRSKKLLVGAVGIEPTTLAWNGTTP